MASKETMEKLLEMAKRKCKITWESEDTTAIITEIVEESCVAVKSKIGINAHADDSVFLEPGLARTLWKEYCLYKWNDMAEEFDNAYLGEIMQARRENEVSYYEKKKEAQI